jgi:signal transduction histidine kinase
MNKDLGKTLLAKTDTIIENWIEAIREKSEIDSAQSLTYKSVRNSIPMVVEALAHILSQSLDNQPQKLNNKSLEHGIVRAEQGYDVTEILQEYSLLRKIILAEIKPNLLSCSGEKILQTVEFIDELIDEVISLSLKSYVTGRLQELEQLHGQLLLTNQELIRLVATQKEAVSHLAHELKTPLNSIIGFSSLLLQQQQKVTQQEDTSLNLQLTEKVIKNGRQLLRLINNTLEISRYEAGKIQLNLEFIDVRALLQMVTEALEPSARQKNLELIIDFERAPQNVLTDSLRLGQILTNLTSNAIRYTESGTISITCRTDDNEQWSLIVADTGIGITSEDQERVFEPYYRTSSKSSDSPDSTGLGLAIVNKLVKLLQGKIYLVSKPAEGSAFTITFPLIITEN